MSTNPNNPLDLTPEELAMIAEYRERREAKVEADAEPINGTSANSSPAPNPKTSSIQFPESCLVGSIGDYARVMSAGSEVPPEFFFAAGLTMVGAIAADRLKLNLSFDVEPRLYTILLGESYRVKKSTALRQSAEFFTRVAGNLGLLAPPASPPVPVPKDFRDANLNDINPNPTPRTPAKRSDFHVLAGSPGSAEGLMRCFREHRSIMLALDELKMLIDKASITGSSLLSVVTSLFEGTAWESPIKNKSDSAGCVDAHLSLAGCCTLDTYDDIWTPEAMAIGLTNRLFVVTSDARPKVSWARRRDPAVLEALQDHITAQLARLPMELDITPDAYTAWDAWYHGAPSSVHARRLETIGYRLLALIALTTDKQAIDAEVVAVVTQILDYEFSVRMLTDPIDADAKIAKLEEKIRRQLDRRGALNDRELRQFTNANKAGLWAYKTAKANLLEHRDIAVDKHTGLFRRTGMADAPIPPPTGAGGAASRDQARAAEGGEPREG
jgi:hypothetical protein